VLTLTLTTLTLNTLAVTVTLSLSLTLSPPEPLSLTLPLTLPPTPWPSPGALSTSGGLAQLHAALYARGRRTPALINFALHAYVAIATCMLLPPCAAQGSSPRLVAHPRHILSCYLAFLHLPLDRPTGLPALNASGSEGRLSQQAQLELQRAQQPARAQWQRLQQLIHEKPAAAAAALVEQDPGPPATRNSSAVVKLGEEVKSK
jgi:hypothetical protein